MSTTRPYPLRFEPILKEKVWGGRRLAALGKAIGPEALVGESWEIADLARTSVSGGGGDAARSIILSGPRAGATLHEVMHEWGEALLGGAAPADDGGFPLLIKFLDAGENLSVQVHPSVEYAAKHADAYVKHEAWCVVDAAPGASIYCGLQPKETRETLTQRIASGSVADAMIAIPATPGNIIHLPSGVVHALGAGVLVAEVQTPSDTTYRLDDWGRTGRELHVDAALDSAFDESGRPTIAALDLPAPSRDVVSTEAFRIEQHVLRNGGAVELETRNSPLILMALRGGANVNFTDHDAMSLDAGETVLIPAALERCTARGDAALLAITIP